MSGIRQFTVISIVLMFSLNQVKAQSFEKGAMVISLSGQYGSYTEKVEMGGNSETKSDPRSVLTPLSFEYGITNRFGLGLDLTYNFYFINDDDDEKSNRTYEIGISANYHLFNSDKNDFYVTGRFGYSRLNINYDSSNVIDNNRSDGWYYAFEINDRYYLTDKFGLLASIGFRGMVYSPVRTEASVSIPEFDLSYYGFTAGLGFVYKL